MMIELEKTPASAALINLIGAVDHGIVYVLDLNRGRVEFITEETRDMLGYPREAFEGASLNLHGPKGEFLRSIVHEDDLAAFKEHIEGLRLGSQGGFSTLLCRWKRADGAWRWIESRSRALAFDAQGYVRTVVGVSIDVTSNNEPDTARSENVLSLLRAEEAERERIARELHDSTAQYLVAIELCTARARNFVGAEQDQARVAVQAMEEIAELAAALQQELRVSVFAMHPPELERNGLVQVLTDLAAGFSRRTGIRTHFEILGEPYPLSSTAEHALLRVSQEALLNVHKHAGASTARVRLNFVGDGVQLEIEDNGVGHSAPQPGVGVGGMGLANMKDRISALGGTLSVAARRKGFLVRASVPSAERVGLKH